MKSIFLLLCFCLCASLTVDAQCYRKKEPVAHFTMTYGTENTGGADLALSANNVRIGVGAMALVDEKTYRETINEVDYRYKRFETAVYGLLGYQFKHVVLGGIVGNKFINPNEYNDSPKMQNENELMYGGFVGYRITQRLAVNVGYNTMSELNFGVSVGI